MLGAAAASCSYSQPTMGPPRIVSGGSTLLPSMAAALAGRPAAPSGEASLWAPTPPANETAATSLHASLPPQCNGPTWHWSWDFVCNPALSQQ